MNKKGPEEWAQLQEIGNRVRELRWAYGMRKQELGAAVGVSARTITAIEGGENECQVLTILKIADVFGESCDWILRGPRVE